MKQKTKKETKTWEQRKYPIMANSEIKYGNIHQTENHVAIKNYDVVVYFHENVLVAY